MTIDKTIGDFMHQLTIRLLFAILTLQLYSLAASLDTSIEVRAAAFIHTSDRFKEIYGTASGNYQAEAATRFCFYGMELEHWTNVDWFFKRGSSDNFKEHTRVSIATASSGLKLPYHFCNSWTAYIGIGPSFGRIWLRNQLDKGYEKTSRFTVGCVVKSGICYALTPALFLDLFIDYNYQPVHFYKHLDIGGAKIGGGIGYRF